MAFTEPVETVYEQQLREMSAHPEQMSSRRRVGRVMSFTIQAENEGRLRRQSEVTGEPMSGIVNVALRDYLARNAV